MTQRSTLVHLERGVHAMLNAVAKFQAVLGPIAQGDGLDDIQRRLMRQAEAEFHVAGSAFKAAELSPVPDITLGAMTPGELQRVMQHAADAAANSLPANTGFILLATEFERPGDAQIITNARRADAVDWLRQTAARLEAHEERPVADAPPLD